MLLLHTGKKKQWRGKEGEREGKRKIFLDFAEICYFYIIGRRTAGS